MTAREALRAATRGAHDRVDEAFGAIDLGRPDGYGAFLLAHAAALMPLEGWLEEAGVRDVVGDWPRRRRSGALAGDLAELGLRLPPSQHWAAAADPAGLLGVLYVLEGSRLGARLLIGRVPPSCGGATRYLGHGAQDRLWPGFLAALEAHEAAARRPEVMVAAALSAFALFEAAARDASAPSHPDNQGADDGTTRARAATG